MTNFKEEHKVKILITKTSSWNYEEVKEYENLESCVDELLSRHELYGNNTPEVVVCKKRPWLKDEPDVDYVVEIYDTWRE